MKTSIKTMAVAVPGVRYCGIQDYAYFLNEELQKNWRLVKIGMPLNRVSTAWKRAAAEADAADIVLVHYEYGLFGSVKPYRNHFVEFMKSLKPPVIVILHDLLPELRPRFMSQKSYRLQDAMRDLAYLPFFSGWSTKLYALADQFIIHAPQLKKRIHEDGVEVEVSFVQHPVPPSTRRWSFAQSKKYAFVTPGFIKKHKGYLDFLQVVSKCPSWNWLIAGGPQNEVDQRFAQQLRSQIKELGLTDRVMISGYQSRACLDEMMSQASWAVFPYQRVTNSGALAWAVAIGMPVMATDLATFTMLAGAHAGLALLPRNNPEQWPILVDELLCNSERQQRLASDNIEFGRLNSYENLARQISVMAMDVLGGTGTMGIPVE